MTTNQHHQPHRYGGLLGVAGGALAIGGMFAIMTVDFTPDAAEAAASFTDDTGRILGGAQILVIGAVLLAAFGAVLQRRIRAALPDSALSIAAAAGYTAAAVAAVVSGTVMAVGALRGDTDSGITETQATTLFDIGYVALGAAMPVLLALGVGATSIASMRSGSVLPKWLAWIGAPLTIGLVILPINWAVAPIALGWTIVAGVLLSAQAPVVDVSDSRTRTAVSV